MEAFYADVKIATEKLVKEMTEKIMALNAENAELKARIAERDIKISTLANQVEDTSRKYKLLKKAVKQQDKERLQFGADAINIAKKLTTGVAVTMSSDEEDADGTNGTKDEPPIKQPKLVIHKDSGVHGSRSTISSPSSQDSTSGSEKSDGNVEDKPIEKDWRLDSLKLKMRSRRDLPDGVGIGKREETSKTEDNNGNDSTDKDNTGS